VRQFNSGKLKAKAARKCANQGNCTGWSAAKRERKILGRRTESILAEEKLANGRNVWMPALAHAG
jgi:hypothetical protein